MFTEKALLAVIPSQRDFPYAIHLNSEVLASDGSSSTTSVCGGTHQFEYVIRVIVFLQLAYFYKVLSSLSVLEISSAINILK